MTPQELIKQVNLYLPYGWADMGSMLAFPSNCIIILGGRGTGKTYGGFENLLYTEEKPFIYMRRTQVQLDSAATVELSPFRPINKDRGEHIQAVKIPHTKNYKYLRHKETEDGLLEPYGEPLAISISLSSVASQRGFNADGFDWLIFDEIIRQPDEKRLYDEGEALLNAYETLNRNRELAGENPIKLVMLGNTNIPDSDILDAFGLVDLVDIMRRKNTDRWVSENGDIAVFNLKDSPISKKKANTFLYRNSASKSFNEMALKNNFGAGTYEHIVRKTPPMVEYNPLVRWEDITVYQHKSDLLYYVTRYSSGKCPEFTDLPTEKTQFLLKYGNLILEYDRGRVKFKDYYAKKRFLNLFLKK